MLDISCYDGCSGGVVCCDVGGGEGVVVVLVVLVVVVMIVLEVAVVIVVISLAKNGNILLVALVYHINVADCVGVSVGWVIGGCGAVGCIDDGGGSGDNCLRGGSLCAKLS